MNGTTLREARVAKGWTQEEAATEFGVTQAYWSMLEKGHRAVSAPLVRKALKVLRLPPTALPLPEDEESRGVPTRKHDFCAELGALGYPGFAYLGKKATVNPALLLSDGLNEPNLEVRVAEALPWVILTFPKMDWDWLLRTTKLHDRQNRLGFAVALAREVAERKDERDRDDELKDYLARLEHARLAREDTFCRDAMTQAERKWLRERRSATAAHWNLLTDMRGDRLAYD